MKKQKNCCVTEKGAKKGTDNSAELSRVNRIRGQVEGIGRMIQQQSYCPDIITQIQAARSALGSLQAAVLASHLNHCVRKGLTKGSEKESEQLLEELLSIFKRY